MSRALVVPAMVLVLVGCPSRDCPEPTVPADEPVEQPETAEGEVVPATAGLRRVALAVPTAGAEQVEPLVVHFIDVGQGDCTLIECPNGDNIVVDCGSSAAGDRERVRARFGELLGEDGVVDVLVVTHPDADHINYLVDVIGRRKVERALLSLDEGAYTGSQTGQEMITWLEQRLAVFNAQPEYLDAGFHDAEGEPSGRFSCGDVGIHVLAASVQGTSESGESWERNTASVVLRLEREVGGETFRALLTGDGTVDTEAAIMQRYSADFLDVDVLKVGHHGSETSTSDGWLAVTTPSYAITTAGHHNGYDLPRCSVVNRVLDAGLETYAGCHELECGRPEPGEVCSTSSPPEWCDYASTYGLYNSRNNGDVSFSFDGDLSVSVERGQGGCDRNER